MNAPCICPECGQPRPNKHGVTFDNQIVSRDGEAVYLPPKQALFFKCLWERFPRPQSKLAVWDYLYDGGFAGDPEVKIIDIYHHHIRKALRPLEIGIKAPWGGKLSLIFEASEIDMRASGNTKPTPAQLDDIRHRWGRLETDREISAGTGLDLCVIYYWRRKMDLVRRKGETCTLRRRAAA